MNRVGLRVLLLGVVAAVATAAVAWWVIPLVGAVFALVTVRRGRSLAVTIPMVAVLLGWAALVAVAAVQGGAGRVATVMGGVLGLPGWALFVVTPVYGALLAGAGALVGSSFTRNPRRHAP